MRCLLIALFTIAANVGSAHAWGDTGHRVVCEIAFRISAPEIRAEIRRLIQMDSEFDFFRDSCIWPDHPRKRASDHFINLRRDAAWIGPDEQCPTASSCTLTAIEDDMGVLSSPASAMKTNCNL